LGRGPVNAKHANNYTKSLGLRNKTDDQDARALAGFGQERRPVPWQPPSKAQAELRDMARTRTDLVEARVAMKLRLNDHEKASKQARQSLERTIKTLDKEIEGLEKAIQKHTQQEPTMSRQITLMTSIKGVGIIVAATVLAELGDLRRFVRSRQLTAFAGVNPRVWQSGTSVKARTCMCREGSRRLRAVMFMAAKSAVRFNPDMAKFYANLKAAGKHHMSAMGAVMRKLLVVIRAVIKADREWQPVCS
jgi:transposase